MKEITAGITTPEQAKRAAEFYELMNRRRADGHFTTSSVVGIGEAITIEFEGKKRTAIVAWAKTIDGELTQVFFRWTDDTPNAAVSERGAAAHEAKDDGCHASA